MVLITWPSSFDRIRVISELALMVNVPPFGFGNALYRTDPFSEERERQASIFREVEDVPVQPLASVPVTE